MNINFTIVGQSISFAIFVLFCMKFVWPPIMQAIEERQQKIADGLNAAEKAKSDLQSAQQDAQAELEVAKGKAAQLIDQANKSANQIVEQAKAQAVAESEKIKEKAASELQHEVLQTRDALRAQVAELAVDGAQKIIQKDVNKETHSEMLQQLAAKL